jgi:hypothetical protein
MNEHFERRFGGFQLQTKFLDACQFFTSVAESFGV